MECTPWARERRIRDAADLIYKMSSSGARQDELERAIRYSADVIDDTDVERSYIRNSITGLIVKYFGDESLEDILDGKDTLIKELMETSESLRKIIEAKNKEIERLKDTASNVMHNDSDKLCAKLQDIFDRRKTYDGYSTFYLLNTLDRFDYLFTVLIEDLEDLDSTLDGEHYLIFKELEYFRLGLLGVFNHSMHELDDIIASKNGGDDNSD